MLLLHLLVFSICTGVTVNGLSCFEQPVDPCQHSEERPDPDNCSDYFDCPLGTSSWRRRSCPEGSSFDSVRKRCLSPSQSVCAVPCAQSSEPTITDLGMTSSPIDLHEGGFVKVSCRALIIGPVTSYNVSWYVNNTYHLSNGSRVTIIDSTSAEGENQIRLSSTLEINKLKATYSGKVQCKVSADSISQNISENFLILAKPRVSLSPITVSQKMKTQLMMMCSVYVLENGHPGAYEQVEIQWFQDGGMISNSNVEQKDSAHSEAALEVEVKNGTTSYSCVAVNKAGSSEADYCTVYGYEPAELPQCPEEKIGELTWPPTPTGVVHRLPCPDPLLGEASRSCVLDENGEAAWMTVNMTECTDPAFYKVDQMTQHMEEGFGADNPATLRTVATSLEELSSDDEKDGMRAGNLRATLNALSGLAKVRSQGSCDQVTNKEISAVVTTVSNILSDKNKDAWGSILEQNSNHAVALLMAVEHYAHVLSDGLQNKSVGFQSDNLLLQKESLDSSQLAEQTYPDKNLDASDPWVTQSEDSLTFNKQTLQQIAETLGGQDFTISSAYFRNVETLLPKSENSSVNSRILSVSVEDLPANTRFSKPIIVKLQYLETIQSGFYPHCSFWNFSAGNEGTWSSDGCTLIYRDRNEAWCECNHLTNFAIIISPYRPDGIHATVLSIISMVGCLISIVGLCLTTLIYAILWKQIRSHHNIIFLNLCVCLILANILFLAGIEQTEDRAGCVTIAAFLHYLFLAVFFIMLAEGIELLLYIVFVFHVKTHRETVALLFGAWGMPAVIVGITLGVTKTIGYGNDDFCWLTIEKGVIWAFIAPAIVIIVANTVIIVMVLHSVANSPSASRHREKRKDHWRWAKQMSN